MEIAVIGGGASGMMAAITAASMGAEVRLLEGGSLLGKKILSTGNGRCNLSNRSLDPSLYQGSFRRHASLLLKEYGVEETLAFFHGIGIPTVTAASARGNDAWVYPSCKEASAVRMALEIECERQGAASLLNRKILQIRKQEGRFILTDEQGEELCADRVILASGGKAMPKTGSDGSGYALAQQAGHSLVAPLPALGPLISDSPHLKNISGLRAEGLLSLWVDGGEIAREFGEIQFTDYGLSGIPVFQLSGRAVRELVADHKVEILVDFQPELSREELLMTLSDRVRRRSQRESGTLLLGLVPSKLVPVLLKESRIPLHVPCSEIPQNSLVRLTDLLKRFAFSITDARDFDAAQLTSGGIPATEVSLNLESIKVKGLYFAGEILDLDGPCGGYNLQWAWSSGHAAGKAAAREDVL